MNRKIRFILCALVCWTPVAILLALLGWSVSRAVPAEWRFLLVLPGYIIAIFMAILVTELTHRVFCDREFADERHVYLRLLLREISVFQEVREEDRAAVSSEELLRQMIAATQGAPEEWLAPEELAQSLDAAKRYYRTSAAAPVSRNRIRSTAGQLGQHAHDAFSARFAERELCPR